MADSRLPARLVSHRRKYHCHLWTPEEDRVISRYARAMAQGQFRSAVRAAAACRESDACPAFRSMSLPALQVRILRQARRLKLRWPGLEWSARELSLVRRHALALMHGRFRSAAAAARACHRELVRFYARTGVGGSGRLTGPHCRALKSVHEQMLREAHALGRPRMQVKWSPQESRIVDRHIRALLEGRYRYVHEAVAACVAETRALHDRGVAGILPRPAAGVKRVIVERLRSLRLPRYRGRLIAVEESTVERYARAVDQGRYQTWKQAARACLNELKSKADARARRGPIKVNRVADRNLQTVHVRILGVAHRLGLRGPRRVLWTPAETRVCREWARWYGRNRRVRRLPMLLAAAMGLQEDLSMMGSNRGLGACRKRVWLEWLRVLGVA